MMTNKQLFDEWPERYDRWFTTPIGKLVKEIEVGLIHELLDPGPKEKILDAGCGTGLFTLDFLTSEAQVVGLDISHQMLKYAMKNTSGYPFFKVHADMLYLPFKDNSFDKSVSVTALEFVADAKSAIDELVRVTRPGGYIVVATLNSLSSWATRRREMTLKKPDHVLGHAFFRSPYELLSYCHLKGIAKSVIHFRKDDNPEEAMKIEQSGQLEKLDTGAFAAVRWEKPRLA
jgi:ubiquinone/menaquinone biosynthesis C-methylase UbiE